MDRSAQLDELDSLKSIYYSEEFQVTENSDPNEDIQVMFLAFLRVQDDYQVKYVERIDAKEKSLMTVKHLPPIELLLTLPKDYPSKNPPNFVISCQWLSKSDISSLCKKLDVIWEEHKGVEIIYMWCDFLKNDSLTFLGYEDRLDITKLCLKHLLYIQKLQELDGGGKEGGDKNDINGMEEKMENLQVSEVLDNKQSNKVPENSDLPDGGTQSISESSDNLGVTSKQIKNNNNNKYKKLNSQMKKNNYDERAVLSFNMKVSLVRLLENYNAERESVEFLRNFFTCNICFCDKLGKDCTKFKDCNHVFCVTCIRSYFTVKIEDGSVVSIKCPEDKCTSEALPSQVKDIVSEELYAKYDSVLLNKALDTLNDIIYCPRQICQYPVSWDPKEKMASCPNCQYVFCVSCRMVYHGIEPCRYKSNEIRKIVEKYENGSAEVKGQMESRYGKKNLENLINEIKAEDWIKDNSKACPKCETAIEKSLGCNKMVCWKCNAYFCWLCLSILDVKNPYLHFRDPLSQCANKLFYLVHISEDEDDEDDDDWDWVDYRLDEFSDTDYDTENDDVFRDYDSADD